MLKNKTLWLKISSAFTAALTMLAALPYQLGDIAMLISPEWKSQIAAIGIIATFWLRVIGQIVEIKLEEKK